MPDQVSFTEVDKSHTQTASSGSENRWQDISSGIMAGAGLAAKAGSKYATVDNLKDVGKACVEGAIIGSAGQVGKAGAKLAGEALKEAIKGGIEKATDNIVPDKSGRSLNKADDAADAGKKSGKDKATEGAAQAIEHGAAIVGGAAIGRSAADAIRAARAAEAAKEAGRAVGQKAIENKAKVLPEKDFDLKGEILSTPKDIADHFKKHPIRATAEAFALPSLLIIDAKLSKD